MSRSTAGAWLAARRDGDPRRVLHAGADRAVRHLDRLASYEDRSEYSIDSGSTSTVTRLASAGSRHARAAAPRASPSAVVPFRKNCARCSPRSGSAAPAPGPRSRSPGRGRGSSGPRSRVARPWPPRTCGRDDDVDHRDQRRIAHRAAEFDLLVVERRVVLRARQRML